jgi:iron complex outermembrane recepter protein
MERFFFCLRLHFCRIFIFLFLFSFAFSFVVPSLAAAETAFVVAPTVKQQHLLQPLHSSRQPLALELRPLSDHARSHSRNLINSSKDLPQYYSAFSWFGAQINNPFSSIATAASAATKIITQNKIAKSGAETLNQILADGVGAGVTASDLYGDGSRITVSMRGFGDNANYNTLVLLDGEPVINPDTAPIKLNAVLASTISRIEVMPGSGGVLYGDQAVGGVINVITRVPQRRELHAAITAGSFGARAAQMSIGHVWRDKLGVRVDVVHAAANNYRDNNQNQNNSVNFLLNYRYGDGGDGLESAAAGANRGVYVDNKISELTLIYRKNNQHLQLPGALTWQQVESNPRQQEPGVWDFYNEDSDFWQLVWQQHLRGSWRARVSAVRREADGVGRYGVRPLPLRDERSSSALRLRLTGNLLTGNKLGIAPWSLVIGGDWEQSSYGYMFYDLPIPKNYQHENAVYAQVSIPLHKKLTALLGARMAEAHYDLAAKQLSKPQQLQQSYRAMISNLELSWAANERLRYYLRRAGNVRFAKVDEITRTLRGAPLHAQTGVSYEAGVVWQLPRKALQTERPAQLAMTLYQLDLENEIVFIPIAHAYYYSCNANLDPTRRRGAVVEAAWQLGQHWSLEGSYNFVEAKFSSGSYEGKQVPFVAAHNWRFGLTYNFNDDWYFTWSSNYTGRRYPINDVENRSDALGGFTLHNLSIGYSRPHYDIALRINNLTNKFYYGSVVSAYIPEFDGGGRVVKGVQVKNSYYPTAGINAMLTITLRLDR